jgi:hypothetical protein
MNAALELSEPLIAEVARAAAGCPYFTGIAFSDEAGDSVREVSLSDLA